METISTVSDMWWSWLMHAGWQSTLVAAVLLTAAWMARRISAPLRYGLLVVALIKFAVPPLMSVTVDTVPESAFLLPMSASAFDRSTAVDRPTNADWTVSQRASPLASEAPAANEADAPAIVEPAVSWPTLHGTMLLGSLYLLGSCMVLGILIGGHMRLQRLLRQSRRLDSSPVFDRFNALHRRLGVRCRVELLVAPGDFPPMATGLFRRTIVLPESLIETLDNKNIDIILAHELAHHRRNDIWCIAFENVLLVAWWFNPVFWGLLRSLRSAREDCCDDLLLEGGVTDDDTYCESLLRAAAIMRRPLMMRTAPGFADRLHPLGRRLQRIMDLSIPRRTRLSPMAMAGLLTLAFCVWPGVQFVAAQPALTPDWTQQLLSHDGPDILEQTAGTLEFQGLYRHRSQGDLFDAPEIRWMKRQQDGQLTVISDVPFMETIFLAEGGTSAGITRFESHCWGNDDYSMTMAFDAGNVTVSWPEARGTWLNNEYAVPARAVFVPNSDPDPFAAVPILLELMPPPQGAYEETEAFDWNRDASGFHQHRVRVANLGEQEVTVPCGRFLATHMTIEQTMEGDTLLRKARHDVTDVWVLDNGVIVRILRSRGPYEIDLLDWKSPDMLPGLIERWQPDMLEPSAANPTPRPPLTAVREPIRYEEQFYESWTQHGFTMPYDAAMYLTAVSGRSMGVSQLGIITVGQGCEVVLQGLPVSPAPAGEALAGTFKKGETIGFCLSTTSRGKTATASTLDSKGAAQSVFQDTDGSRNGQPTVQQVGPDRWMMNLDDVNPEDDSDDDEDIQVVLRLEKI